MMAGKRSPAKRNRFRHRNRPGASPRSSELKRLRARLGEAQDTLDAISSGQVDAVLVRGTEGGPRVLKLNGEDHPYRVFVETMNDGAVTLLADGTIIYGNLRFAQIANKPLDVLIGNRFQNLVMPYDRQRLEQLLIEVQTGGCRGELQLESPNGPEVWVQLALSPLGLGPSTVVCMVVSDISKQKALERQLQDQNLELTRQNDKVQQASRFKSEFLANMSHELRSPLNGIIGFSELLYDGRLGLLQEPMKSIVGRVHDSAKYLLQLINGVLDLSKIEAGRMEFRPERVVISELIGQVIEILQSMADEKSLHIRAAIDPAANEAWIDPVRFKEVLFNYLSNALKFSESGGAITVSVKAEDASRFRLEVTDTGIGISEEDAARLFVEFQQLCNSRTKCYHGTGLGLALTKRIVEAQGGTVAVKSTPGEGSTFIAVLPRITEQSREAANHGRMLAAPAPEKT